MDSRLVSSVRENRGRASSNCPRKGNKYSGQKGNSWMCGCGGHPQNDLATSGQPSIGYPRIVWQASNGQCVQTDGRSFSGASERGLCGYSAIPVPCTVEPVSLPAVYSFYQPVPVPDVKSNRGRSRRYSDGKRRAARTATDSYSSLGRLSTSRKNGAGFAALTALRGEEYASLPPTVYEKSENEDDNVSSERRRYSDPGVRLAGEALPSYGESDDSDTGESSSSITTVGRGNKLVMSLVEQVTELKKSNCQLFREVSLAKSDVERLKGKLAARESAISGEYQPGMLADLVREIREANKMCEEGLIGKLKTTLEDDENRMSREMDRLKSQLLKMTQEKEESDKRLAKLEEEVAALRLNARLEKLVHLLRDEMNGAVAVENAGGRATAVLPPKTVNNPCSSIIENGSIVGRIGRGSASGSGSASEPEDHAKEDKSDGCPETRGNSMFSDDAKLLTSLRYAMSCDEAAVSLCGPVTDL